MVWCVCVCVHQVEMDCSILVSVLKFDVFAGVHTFVPVPEWGYETHQGMFLIVTVPQSIAM